MSRDRSRSKNTKVLIASRILSQLIFNTSSVPPALRAEGHYAVPLQFWHFIVLIATACTQGILDLYDTLCKAGGTILSLLNRNNITSLNTN